ncbi:nucleotidyltransferase family protein [Dongia rigui]|uniref:Nucleotidyltransferase family protein n=1 Tax=Dongia rigui TaxID=940149 RepID=A0ABU5E4F2_9PROT|nr:nucleotidyltransferase family protein [Dongia rigui]MDY0874302.1 nucleotidyltransferase family protein [Dongia rigui]
MSPAPFNALILAGNRREGDSVAVLAGVTHKALAPINGVPMLLRLYRTLRSVEGVADIHVCIDDGALLDTVPELAAARASGAIKVVAPEASPAASLGAALDIIGLQHPLLTTTADHPLLTAAMVSHMLKNAPADAELAVGLAEAETVTAVYPEAIRTFYRFKGRRFSGCNLFLARDSNARKVASYWQRMERHRKKPWRLVLEVGPLALLRMAVGRLSLDDAFQHVSRLTGARIRPVLMPFAEAPIDVDKPADFELVTEILRRREGAA